MQMLTRPPAIGLRALIVGIVTFAAFLPLIVFPLGIAGDYPNHLARVYIEASLADSPLLQEYFAVSWGIYPDLAMDMFMRPLMQFMDPYSAGAIFNVVAVAMLPLGVALLSRAVHGRVTLPALAAVLLIYSHPLAWGFINFLFSAGFALCLLALWISLVAGWGRTLLFALLTPVLFFSHVLGFLLFGYLLLSYELGRFAAGARGRLGHFMARLLLRDGLIAVLPLFLFLTSLEDRLSQLQTQIHGFGGLSERMDAIVMPFNFDNDILAAICCVVLSYALFTAIRKGWIVVAPRMWPVVVSTALLVLMTPTSFSGISFLNIRFGAIPFAVLFAASSLTPEGQKQIKGLVVVFLGLFAAQMVNASQRIALNHQVQSEVRDALSVLPPGARVLVGRHALNDFVVRFVHLPALSVIEADGYVVNLFTNTSPVAVTEKIAPFHRPQAWPLTREKLLIGADLAVPLGSARNGIQEDYFHGWPSTFDALFWFSPPAVPSLENPHLRLVVQGSNFQLYTIRRK